LVIHYITGDQSQELWISGSNPAERDAWEQCLQQNILAAQIAFMVTQSYVQREVYRQVRDIVPGVSKEEFKPINTALMKETFSIPGRSFMCITPAEQTPVVSAKEAKKLEKEKRKQEKEIEKAEKKKKNKQ